MAEDDSGAETPSKPMGFPDHERSAPTVDAAVAQAEAGSQAHGVQNRSEVADEDARVAEIEGVEGATDGTVEQSSGTSATTPQPGLRPTETGSGGAQDIAGARISDRVAGGQPGPDGAPFVASPEDDSSVR